MLEFEHVSFSVKDNGFSKPIFEDFSLKFPKSGLAVITGPNGSGKSTLAQILMGIKKPAEGKVILDGNDVTNKNVTERAKLGLAFSFQQPVKIKGITVYELIDIALGEGADPKEIGKLLTMVGLDSEKYLNREVDSGLSGGEMKRIEIASVLARKAKISIFDEPEAGIDLWSFNDLKNVFKKIRKDNPESLLIIISHQEKILEIADEIIVLDGGKIIRRGTPDVILPNLERGQNGI